MIASQEQEIARLAALRAERAAGDAAARAERLAEARRWEDYLCTTFDQLTARLGRAPIADRRRAA